MGKRSLLLEIVLVWFITTLGSSRPKMDHVSRNGSMVTVLSIDGGGIRGVIPGTLLAFLESKLQVRTYVFSWYQ